MTDRLLRVAYWASASVVIANGVIATISLVNGSNPYPGWRFAAILPASVYMIVVGLRPKLWARIRPAAERR